MPPYASYPAPSTRQQHQPASHIPSQTQTQTVTPPHPQASVPAGTLRLRATAAPNDARVRWAEDVIDNEGLGRKRSKVCCIYHAPREVGESSSESSSDSSDSDSDSEGGGGDDGSARMGGKGKGRRNKGHAHDGDGDCGGHNEKRKGKRKNAYESEPKAKGGGEEGLKS